MRQWMETCFPAQIRAVLRNPAWSMYSIEELCGIGLRGARGLRPGMKASKLAARAQLQATREQSAREQTLGTVTDTDTQDLADEFL